MPIREVIQLLKVGHRAQVAKMKVKTTLAYQIRSRSVRLSIGWTEIVPRIVHGEICVLNLCDSTEAR
jgi:hypothetical protein